MINLQFPLFASMIAPVSASFVGGEIFNLIRQTGAVAQVVLIILLIFSILSWSIILTKWGSIKRARAQSGRFLRAFRKAQRLQDVAAVSEQFKPSPLVAVFDNAYDEFRRQGEGNINAVQRAAQIASSEELSRLERRLPWLATPALSRRLSDCLARCGASLTRSTAWAQPTPPRCALSRQEFPKR